MKKIIFFLVTIVFTNSQAQINSDYDKSIDFSKYKTISFAGWEKNSGRLLNEFDKERLSNALKYEFESRGIETVDNNGDAQITLYLVIRDKTDITAYTTYNTGLGYYGRWGYARGGYGTTNVSSYDYLEGTLVIDMYDNDNKKLVWQGEITDVIQKKASKREKTIPKNMKKLMKKFPVKRKK